MEELKDASIHHTAIKLSNDIKTMKLYGELFKRVQGLACQPTVDKNDLRNSLEDAIKSTGLDTELRNIIFHLVRTTIKNDHPSTNFVSFFLFILRIFFDVSLQGGSFGLFEKSWRSVGQKSSKVLELDV